MSTKKEINCEFCGESAQLLYHPHIRSSFVECSGCDEYWITSQVSDEIKRLDVGKQGLLNCAKQNLIFRMQSPNQTYFWVKNEEIVHRLSVELDKHLGSYPENGVPCSFQDIALTDIDHSRKPMLLLSAIAKRLARSGPYDPFVVSSRDRIIAGISSGYEIDAMMSDLYNRNYISQVKSKDNSRSIDFRLSADGWAAINRVKREKPSNKVFIATQFKWPEMSNQQSETMRAIKEACSSLGFEADTVTQDHTGNISEKILSEIKDSRFVVAEFTFNNRGVYYEAGYAKGLGIPVYHVVNKSHVDGPDIEGKKVHFDIKQIRYQDWESSDELKEKLNDWINVTEGKYLG